MNTISSMILWMAVQTALFSVVGTVAYLWLRRRGPIAATRFAVTVLALTLPLAALVVSPWPRWEWKSQISNFRSQTSSTQDSHTSQTDVAAAAGSENTSGAEGAMLSRLSGFWQDSTDWLQPGGELDAAARAKPQAVWMRWLPWVLAGGISIGLVRLALGIALVNRYRRDSRLIEDEALIALACELAREFPTELFELRDTIAPRSAATVGWRKPVILLPVDWRDWNETELRTVLAHELAHIARRDYLTALVARLVTAIHFYQPLLIWLGRQLRIEQELAADHRAAMVAGNRQTYLATLARIALRADDQPLPWAARAFLPGTSMLIKRVAWLKKGGPRVEESLSRRSWWALVAGLLLLLVGVAGIRGPNRSLESVAVAADDAGSAMAAKFSRSFKYIPADAVFVAAVSPAELAKLPSGVKFFEIANAEIQKNFGQKLSDVADVQLIKTTTTAMFDKTGTPHFERIIVHSTRPIDWKGMLMHHAEANHASVTTKQFDGKKYFGEGQQWCFIPDEQTLIGGPEEEIRKIIEGGGQRLMDANQFPEFESEPVAVRAEMSFVKEAAGLSKLPRSFEANPVAATVLPVLDHVSVAHGGAVVDGGDHLELKAVLDCDSVDGAKQVTATLDAVKVVGLNVLRAKQAAWQETAAPPAPQGQIAATGAFIDMVCKALSETEVRADGNQSIVKAEVSFGCGGGQRDDASDGSEPRGSDAAADDEQYEADCDGDVYV